MAIKENKELNESLASVQEKLSVCYAKEAKYEALIESLKDKQINSGEVESLRSKVKSLTEQLNEKDKIIEKVNNHFSKLSESNLNIKKNQNQLNESLHLKDTKINSLINRVNSLKESLNLEEGKVTTLMENLEESKKNLALKSKEYSSKISKANQLVEHYKKIAQTSINKYIESKARNLGMSTDAIKSKLNESYTFEDIDRICEDLQGYQLTASKLPFNLQNNTNKDVRVKVTESIEPIRPKSRFNDDEVDDSLLRMCGLLD